MEKCNNQPTILAHMFQMYSIVFPLSLSFPFLNVKILEQDILTWRFFCSTNNTNSKFFRSKKIESEVFCNNFYNKHFAFGRVILTKVKDLEMKGIISLILYKIIRYIIQINKIYMLLANHLMEYAYHG